MISRYRVTSAADVHGLPRHLRKAVVNSPQNTYFDPHAAMSARTDYIVLTQVDFRQDVSYSQRALASGHSVPLSEMFHEMLVFCEWLKNHADYEFCGSYVTNRPDQYSMSTVFTFTAIVYVCGKNADANNSQGIFTEEFKNSVKQTGISPLAGRDVDAEFMKAFGASLQRMPSREPQKPVVTFNQALDMAKELGR